MAVRRRRMVLALIVGFLAGLFYIVTHNTEEALHSRLLTHAQTAGKVQVLKYCHIALCAKLIHRPFYYQCKYILQFRFAC
jgi:hypothetical protein